MTDEKEKPAKGMSWDDAEDTVINKALDAIEAHLNPYVFKDEITDEKKFMPRPFNHKELMAAVPLFQKRRDLLIALNREKAPKDGFYKSHQWLRLRYQVLTESKAVCGCCGASGRDTTIHVDHIKPRSKYPELELEISNLQVLCSDCNMGKSNIEETDWRVA